MANVPHLAIQNEMQLSQTACDKQKLRAIGAAYIDVSAIRLPESLQLRLAHLNSIYG